MIEGFQLQIVSSQTHQKSSQLETNGIRQNEKGLKNY